MKFKFFSKAAQVARTAIEVADDVNATYYPEHFEDEDLSAYAQENKMSGGDQAIAIVRAALNQDWFDLAKFGFDALVNLFSKDPLPYEDFLAAISEYTDIKIRAFSQEEELRFVGGECNICVSRAEAKVHTKVQLYFKNSLNKWVLKEISGATAFKCFTAETLDGDITDIMNEGGRKFPIMPPED